MSVQNQNFTLWKGDDRILVINIDDVVSLSGFTAKWHIAENANSSPLLIKTSAAGQITFDANNVLVGINSADTKDSVVALPPGEYTHQLRLTDAQNLTTIASEGIVSLKQVIDRI